jgi:hypothetical protein
MDMTVYIGIAIVVAQLTTYLRGAAWTKDARLAI